MPRSRSVPFPPARSARSARSVLGSECGYVHGRKPEIHGQLAPVVASCQQNPRQGDRRISVFPVPSTLRTTWRVAGLAEWRGPEPGIFSRFRSPHNEDWLGIRKNLSLAPAWIADRLRDYLN